MTLSRQQLAVVNDESIGDVVVIAGAGSGKTHTALEHAKKYKLEEVLFIPFTTSARDEVKERLSRMFGVCSGHDVSKHVMTLHAFCMEALGSLKEACPSLLPECRDFATSRVCSVKDLLFVFEETWGGMRYLLSALIKSLRPHIRCIYIDEAQDLNEDQYRVVKYLQALYDCKTVSIGDPRQAIFSFQGGNPLLLLKEWIGMGGKVDYYSPVLSSGGFSGTIFERPVQPPVSVSTVMSTVMATATATEACPVQFFAGLKTPIPNPHVPNVEMVPCDPMTLAETTPVRTYKLTTNFRSSPSIIAVANSVSSQAVELVENMDNKMEDGEDSDIPKCLRGHFETPMEPPQVKLEEVSEDRLPAVYNFESSKHEYEWISGEIKILQTLEFVDSSDIAVLARTHREARACFNVLVRNKIACCLDKGDDVHEGGVTLCTIHSSKGREWEYVFVIGARDGRSGVVAPGGIPCLRSEGREAIFEELRLFYVAVTRACRGLYVTHSSSKSGVDGKWYLTRFVRQEDVALFDLNHRIGVDPSGAREVTFFDNAPLGEIDGTSFGDAVPLFERVLVDDEAFVHGVYDGQCSFRRTFYSLVAQKRFALPNAFHAPLSLPSSKPVAVSTSVLPPFLLDFAHNCVYVDSLKGSTTKGVNWSFLSESFCKLMLPPLKTEHVKFIERTCNGVMDLLHPLWLKFFQRPYETPLKPFEDIYPGETSTVKTIMSRYKSGIKVIYKDLCDDREDAGRVSSRDLSAFWCEIMERFAAMNKNQRLRSNDCNVNVGYAVVSKPYRKFLLWCDAVIAKDRYVDSSILRHARRQMWRWTSGEEWVPKTNEIVQISTWNLAFRDGEVENLIRLTSSIRNTSNVSSSSSQKSGWGENERNSFGEIREWVGVQFKACLDLLSRLCDENVPESKRGDMSITLNPWCMRVFTKDNNPNEEDDGDEMSVNSDDTCDSVTEFFDSRFSPPRASKVKVRAHHHHLASCEKGGKSWDLYAFWSHMDGDASRSDETNFDYHYKRVDKPRTWFGKNIEDWKVPVSWTWGNTQESSHTHKIVLIDFNSDSLVVGDNESSEAF